MVDWNASAEGPWPAWSPYLLHREVYEKQRNNIMPKYEHFNSVVPYSLVVSEKESTAFF